ncbi:hypothetical protein ACT3XG_07725 [Paenibacillus polymyxa]|nr:MULTISPECIES: hypothetical protein [Paenibacillus]MEE4581525.1 hypothetical protein [Paenibacillus polymyxa]WHX37325.1 hypothetical protein QNH38_07730 [Paenibacillus polymyxa]
MPANTLTTPLGLYVVEYERLLWYVLLPNLKSNRKKHILRVCLSN